MVILKISSPIIWYFLWFLEKLLIIIILYRSNQKYYDIIIYSKYNTSSTLFIVFFPDRWQIPEALYDVLWRMSQQHLCHVSHVWMWHNWKTRQMWSGSKRDILAFGFRRFFSKFQLSKSHIKNNSKSSTTKVQY